LDSAVKQQITIGAFIAVFNALTEMYAFLEEVICYHIGEMTKGLGKVGNYLDFMRLDEKQDETNVELDYEMTRLTDVSFAYPNTDCNVLDHINLDIKKGETVAIVGENGSGKTTLVKLIMGLYMPTKGKVEIDGHNTERLNRQSVYRKISAVFQNYQKYNMKLDENISISQIDKLATQHDLNDVCKQSGVDTGQWGLADGYQTLLGTEFGGTDLSGGQWQRVAIARGYFRDHELIALDEPTAAIDPYEESLLYHKISEISKAKTALIVTHRMGSVKIADRIVVLKAGRVVEQGPFHELMSKDDGVFRQMYSLQQQWYSTAAGTSPVSRVGSNATCGFAGG
jgi:ATP-binding cassette subfamily B protein